MKLPGSPTNIPRLFYSPLVKNMFHPNLIILHEIFFIISKLRVGRSRHSDVTKGSYFTDH